MKIGIRTPSPKRSISARTTGRLKRSVKRAVNPFYEKKGMGYINNPKKAVYNKVYNKTTVSVTDVVNKTTKNQPAARAPYSAKLYKGLGVFLIAVACFLAFIGLFALPEGLLFMGLGVIPFCIGKKYLNIAKYKKTDEN